MRKLVISAFALAAMTSFAMAAEPVKLTSSQLDQVAAGNPCSINFSKAFGTKQVCVQRNFTKQNANATAIGVLSVAAAANHNSTAQNQGDFNTVTAY
jgi:hypothetical protein